jgi:hypothetical protein
MVSAGVHRSEVDPDTPSPWGVAAHAGDVSRETGGAGPAALGDAQSGPDDPRETDPTMEFSCGPSACGHGAWGLVLPKGMYGSYADGMRRTPGWRQPQPVRVPRDGWLSGRSCALTCRAGTRRATLQSSLPARTSRIGRRCAEERIFRDLLCWATSPRTSPSRHRVPSLSDAAGGSGFSRSVSIDTDGCFT